MKKRIFLTLVFAVTTVTQLLAGPGDTPCGGNDPDDVVNCTPLDTWVIVLAGVAMIFTFLHLTRKQKAAVKAA